MKKRKAGVLKVLVVDDRPEFIEKMRKIFRPYKHVRVEGKCFRECPTDVVEELGPDLLIIEYKTPSTLTEKIVFSKVPKIFVCHDEETFKDAHLACPSKRFAFVPLDPASFLGEVNQLVRLAG